MIVRKELEALQMPPDYAQSTEPSTSDAATRTTSSLKTIPTTRQRSNSLQAIRSLFRSMKRTPSNDVVLRRDEKREKLFMCPGVIDEEPDSMDSIISDPSSFPITVLPPLTSGGAGLLIRNSTAQSSFGRLSRISTNSKWVYLYVK